MKTKNNLTDGEVSYDHELKIAPEYFYHVMDGSKTFEIRRNDRNFQPGDIISLREFEDGKYTGNSRAVMVTYITNYEQKKDYVVLATKLIEYGTWLQNIN